MGLAIGLLHFTSPPVVGGVETVLGHHARLMADAGHAVRMITGRGGRPDPRAELVRIPLADGRHPAVRGVQGALDAGSVPPGLGGLVDTLARDLREATAGLDVVIAHNVCSLNVNTPLTAAIRRLVEDRDIRRLVAWNHDVAAASDRYRTRLHPGYPWDLFRQPWPRTITVTISEARRAELVAATGMPAGEIRVVPNGIDRGRFLGLAPATLGLIDALDLHVAAPVLLTPARVMPRKNLELAVRVVAELRRSGEDARLLLTGAPDAQDPDARGQLDALRMLAKAGGSDHRVGGGGGRADGGGHRADGGGHRADGGIHLLVDGPRAWRSVRVVADLFRVADALFLPSRDEGFGLPVLEAGVSRLPVICTDIPALRELARDDATYVDPDGDPATVAAQVRGRLDADPTYRLAARSRASFDWDAVFETRIRPLLDEAAG